MRSKILVFAAHPDDEVLGCGGTISKAISLGIDVNIVYLSSGDSIEKTREKEAAQVCKFLGVSKHFFLRLKGNTFTVNTKNVSTLVKILHEVQPDFIYINHDQDSDCEHKITYSLVREAHWRFNLSVTKSEKIKGVLLYEVHKPMQTYSITEDISEYIEKKMKAMELYKSQLINSRIDLGAKGLNAFRGTMKEECSYAEVFQLVRLNSFLKTVYQK